MLGGWLLLGGGCRGDGDPSPQDQTPAAGDRQAAPRAPSHVLLITLDTARADRFSYAGGAVATPNIDGLARAGVGFRQAVSPVPVTLPAHASLMTGLNPPGHGVRDNGTYVLSEDRITLAEVLRDQGFRTAAFVGAAVLKASFGLSQGFEHYGDNMEARASGGLFNVPERRGDAVVDAAIEWLKRAKREKTFVWVHLFDPHAPYEPPEPERTTYRGRPYDGEIAYCDRQVGRLVAAYREAGIGGQTLVVVTADHGESLGEHGESTHAIFVYDATTRVPLVMSGPGLPIGKIVDRQIGLIDLMPTILDSLNVPSPPGIDGVSVLPAIKSGQPHGEFSYLESLYPLEHHGWAPLRAIRTPGWKLIRGADVELYDLSADPGERKNVADEHADRVTTLGSELDRLARTTTASTKKELDPAMRAQLEALGYIWTAPSDSSREGAETERPDPRERIGLLEEMGAASRYFARGDRRFALDKLRRMLERDPHNWEAGRRLVQMLSARGSFAEAEARAGALLKIGGGRETPRLAVYRGWALERLGRTREAGRAYEQAASFGPNYEYARGARWEMMLSNDQASLVRKETARLLEEGGGGALARAFEQRAVHHGAPAEELAAALQRALEAHPRNPHLALALAETRLRQGKGAEAEVLYRRFLAAEPDFEVAFAGLGAALLDQGRSLEARELLDRAVDALTLSPRLLLVLSRACQAVEDRGCRAQAMNRAITLEPDARALLRHWIAPRPRAEPWDAVSLADLLLHSGKVATAHELLAWGKREATAAKRRDVVEKADALLTPALDATPPVHTEVRAMLDQNRVADALRTAEEAAAHGAENVDLLAALAEARARSGRTKAALSAIRHALAVDDENAAAWATLGTLHLQASDPEAALFSFGRATQLGSTDPMVERNVNTARRLLDQSKTGTMP